MNFYGWEASKAPGRQISAPVGLDFLEGELYNLLLKGEMEIEQIADSLGKRPQELSLALMKLELKGLVVRLAGNRYAIAQGSI